MNPFVSTSRAIHLSKFQTPTYTSNLRTSIYVGNGKKNFKVITRTIEKDNKIIIKRKISWYDCVEKKHRTKVELQVYNCELETPVDDMTTQICSLISEQSI